MRRAPSTGSIGAKFDQHLTSERCSGSLDSIQHSICSIACTSKAAIYGESELLLELVALLVEDTAGGAFELELVRQAWRGLFAFMMKQLVDILETQLTTLSNARQDILAQAGVIWMANVSAMPLHATHCYPISFLFNSPQVLSRSASGNKPRQKARA